MSDIKLYTDRAITAAERASEIKSFAHLAQFNGNNPQVANFIKDDAERSTSVVRAAMSTPLFQGVNEEFVKRVAPVWAESVREYGLKYKQMPKDELLANAYQLVENLMFESGLKQPSGAANVASDKLMFEAVNIPSGTDSIGVSTGIMSQAVFAAMIMPYTLGAATSDMATFVPCARDSSDLYMLRTIATATFGDIKEGDQITPHTAGAYSQMKRRSKVTEVPDGTIKVFNFKVPDAANRDIPVRPDYNKLIVDGFPSENYDSGNKVTWYSENGAAVANQATLEITPAKGQFKVTFNVAPPAGTDILVEYQINIEKRGDLIPTINQVMLKRTIKPNQYALAAEYTIQALFDGRREFNIDVSGGLLAEQRNVISHEIDMTRLRTAIDFTRYFSSFDVAVPLTLDWDKYISLLKGKLSTESTKMANRNMVRGIRGIFAGANAAEILKMMPSTEFAPSDYVDSPHIQYIGRLFGRYNVYQVPDEVCKQFESEGKKFNADTMLCYGRGENIGEAGLVTGDAVPLLPIPHSTSYDLVNRNTMWGSMINDVNPFNGWDYFCMITLTSDKENSYNLVDGTVNPASDAGGAGGADVSGQSLVDDGTNTDGSTEKTTTKK